MDLSNQLLPIYINAIKHKSLLFICWH